jgi:hypothetical protein
VDEASEQQALAKEEAGENRNGEAREEPPRETDDATRPSTSASTSEQETQTDAPEAPAGDFWSSVAGAPSARCDLDCVSVCDDPTGPPYGVRCCMRVDCFARGLILGQMGLRWAQCGARGSGGRGGGGG